MRQSSSQVVEWVKRLFHDNDSSFIWGRSFPTEFIRPVDCDVVIACDERNLEFLAESIHSILNQTSARCIVHVCFDSVQADVSHFMRTFPQIRFYKTNECLGPFRIANEMMRFCQTDYVAIQDADDIALPTRIACSVNELKMKGRHFYGAFMENFCDHRYPGQHIREKSMTAPWHHSGILWAVCPEGALINGTLVFHRARFVELEGYGDLVCSGDVDFCNRINFGRERKIISNKLVALRRLHNKSLTASTFAPGTSLRSDIDRVVIQRYQDLQAKKATPASLGALSQHLMNPKMHPIERNEG